MNILDQQQPLVEKKILAADSSGRFFVGKDSVPMQIWQHADQNGKLCYSLMPAEEPSENSNNSKSENAKEGTWQGHVNEYMNSLVRLCEVSIEFFTCDKCDMKFPMEWMLNRHKMSHNPRNSEKRKYGCSSCDFSCNARSTFTAHLRKKHRLIGVQETTDKPSRRISSQKTSGRSRKKELEDKKTTSLTCDSCSFVCKRSSTLTLHVAQNHRTPNDEGTLPKRRSRAGKKEDESLEPTDVKLSQAPEIDTAIDASTPSALESETQPPVTSDTTKQVDKKPSEEQCNLCEFKCAKKSTLYSHKRQHKIADIGEVYTCNECAFKTCKKSSLYSHIKRKHKVAKSCTADGQPQLFYCSQCDYKNKNKYELKVHVARKHTDDFKFSCETCGKKFKVKGDLTNHIRFSHMEQPVICDVCGKTCLNSNSLYVHQKFAHYKAKYECQVCKRRMVTQENLNEHMIRQHVKRENVVCEECGKTFSRNSRLKVHMRIHTGDKPYTCTICGKSFARRTALKQHLLIHTGIRPYVCDICGKAFTQKPGLISHRKSHPGSHPPLPRVLIDHILNDVMNN